MNLVTLYSDRDPVSLTDLKREIQQLSAVGTLAGISHLMSRHHLGEFRDNLSLINGFNLALAAKGAALWGDLNNENNTSGEDFRSLVMLINSLVENEENLRPVKSKREIVGRLIKQWLAQLPTDFDEKVLLARNWYMYRVLPSKNTYADVPNPLDAFQKHTGVSTNSLWSLLYLFYSYYISAAEARSSKVIINPETIFSDTVSPSKNCQEFKRIAKVIGCSPIELRQKYELIEKYFGSKEATSWQFEYNILRDFPLIRDKNDCYIAPVPKYLLLRAFEGFFYDLDEAFAEELRHKNVKNPYDNAIRRTRGYIFENYVQDQLQTINRELVTITPEFEYIHRGQVCKSPDCILEIEDHTLVVFECKAKDSPIDLQQFTNSDWISASAVAINAALRQTSSFLSKIRSCPSLERFRNFRKVIVVPVLYKILPLSFFPEIRGEWEKVASKHLSALNDVFELQFVPIGIDDLETAVAYDTAGFCKIEAELLKYAKYWRSVDSTAISLTFDSRKFPNTLTEQLQVSGWPLAENKLLRQSFDQFTDFALEELFGQCNAG